MKKRIICCVAIIIVLTMLMGVFVACDNGEDGLSAYELAVQEGFEGTLEEWLDSLKGEDGTNGSNGIDGQDVSIEEIYQVAVENGYEGTFLDFLKEYLSLDIQEDNIPQKALLSSVRIICDFTVTETTYHPIYGEQTQTYEATSSGSGVIYQLDKQNGNAYIITNHHVVYYAKSNTQDGISDSINILLYGSEYQDYMISAQYVGGSATYDIAVLKIENSEILKNSDAVEIEVADYHSATVGSKAIAIGNAAGEGISVTQGIISVDSEVIDISDSDTNETYSYRVLRVDAAINSGNSGGGLFNEKGQLIGIVNAKVSSSSIENIGYAIPVSIAIGVADNIIANCDGENITQMQKYSIGISVIADSSKAVYDGNSMTVKIVEDVKIAEVLETSPLYGQLQAGDIVLSITVNGVKTSVDRTFKVVDSVLSVKEGDNIVIEVLRGSETIEYQIQSASSQNIAAVE